MRFHRHKCILVLGSIALFLQATGVLADDTLVLRPRISAGSVSALPTLPLPRLERKACVYQNELAAYGEIFERASKNVLAMFDQLTAPGFQVIQFRFSPERRLAYKKLLAQAPVELTPEIGQRRARRLPGTRKDSFTKKILSKESFISVNC